MYSLVSTEHTSGDRGVQISPQVSELYFVPFFSLFVFVDSHHHFFKVVQKTHCSVVPIDGCLRALCRLDVREAGWKLAAVQLAEQPVLWAGLAALALSAFSLPLPDTVSASPVSSPLWRS